MSRLFRRAALCALAAGISLSLAGCFMRKKGGKKEGGEVSASKRGGKEAKKEKGEKEEAIKAPSVSPGSEGPFRQIKTRKGVSLQIVTSGVGYPDLSLTEKQKRQRRFKSQRDALVEAQSKMLMIVGDMMLKSGVTVATRMRADKDFVTAVNTAVSKAKVEQEGCSKDDTCTVTIRLNKRDLEKEIGQYVTR